MLSPTAWKILGFLAICPRTLQNLISHLHRNPPEPHQPSAPELSGTYWNLISYLPQNSPEPHQPSAPEPSGTSLAICTRILRLIPEGSGTLRNFLWNLVLQLHRTAPELFWAKDPIANFAVWEKYYMYVHIYLYIYIYLKKEISFGGIPNSNIIYIYIYHIQILMPCLTTWTIFLRSGFAHVDHRPMFKTITWLLLSRLPRRNSLEPSEPSGTYTRSNGTLRNPSGTYTSTWELSGTCRYSPEPPEPSGTCLNPHQHTPEPSGTFWDLSPEPAPATRTGTHRSLSGLKTPWAYAVGEIETNMYGDISIMKRVGIFTRDSLFFLVLFFVLASLQWIFQNFMWGCLVVVFALLAGLKRLQKAKVSAPRA